MRLALVNATRRWGGVKSWTLDAARMLDSFGHRVSIHCRPGPFLDAALALDLDARPFTFGMDYGPGAVLRFLRLFRAEGVDLVMVNVGKDLRTAGLAARLCGIPVVQRVGLPRDMRDTAKVRLTHAFIRPRLLAPCAWIRDEMSRELSFVRPEDVAVILTGKEPAPEPPAIVAEPRRIVVTSQLNADKGHADLLRALAARRDAGQDFALDVLGTGREEESLKALTAELGLGGRVRFHGFTTDVRSVLAEADLFVLPSLSEGLPNTLLEAQSQGLPAVARNVGGVAEAWPGAEWARDFLIAPEPGPALLDRALGAALAVPGNVWLERKRAVWAWFRDNLSLEGQTRQLEAWLTGFVAEARP